MNGPRRWAEATLAPWRREAAAAPDRIPAKIWLALAIHSPRQVHRVIRTRANLAMPMPGDRFEDFQMDETYTVLEAPPGRPMLCMCYPGDMEPFEVDAYRGEAPPPHLGGRTRTRSTRRWTAL